MRVLYDVFIFLYRATIGLASLFGNRKAKLWLSGRKDWETQLDKINSGAGRRRIWFHCASLGEFEQGRPLIEKMKSDDPTLYIILTFFSPSGYELRKDFPLADYVAYLPLDTKRNARKFVEVISPSMAIFVKYEFWPHYFEELGRKRIPLYIASAIFRPTQIFFRWYGGFYKKILSHVKYFFVQDESSKNLLTRVGFSNVSVTGDTRFDRVLKITGEMKSLSLVQKFKSDSRIIVAGSTWPADEEIFLNALKHISNDNLKTIIAPHEISEERISGLCSEIARVFPGSGITKYSSNTIPENCNFLVVDNIGMLSSLYRYGSLSWIGGGFGKGIHNILEAAAYGMPVIFGPEHEKFREARELLKAGGAFSVRNKEEAVDVIRDLLENPEKLERCSGVCRDYVRQNSGATERILNIIQNLEVHSVKTAVH